MVRTLELPKMSQKQREKKGENGTRQIRVYDDLADMIGEIIDVEGGTAAALIDPLLRPQISAKHRQLEPEIQKIRKAKENLERARAAARRRSTD
jgi:hypothetical protein